MRLERLMRIHVVLTLVLVGSLLLQPVISLNAQTVGDGTPAPAVETDAPATEPAGEETETPIPDPTETEPVVPAPVEPEPTAPIQEETETPVASVEPTATVPPTSELPAESPMQPAQEATTRVTFALSSADPMISQMGGSSTWSVSTVSRGATWYFGGSNGNLTLPQTFNSFLLSDVPQGQAVVTVDAGPEFDVWTQTVTISGTAQTLVIVLQPKKTVNTGEFVFTISSADPATRDELPVATSVRIYDAAGTLVFSRAGLPTYLPQTLQVPAYTSTPLPFGEYRVVITPPSGFERFERTFTLSAARQSESIQLQPIVPAYTGTVTVLEADGVSPVSGATVTLPDGRPVQTGADGVATFTDVRTGEHAITVTASDGRTATGTLAIANANGAVTVNLPAAVTQLQITLSSCPDLSGVRVGDVFVLEFTATNTGTVNITSVTGRSHNAASRTATPADPALPRTLTPGQSFTSTAAYVVHQDETVRGYLFGSVGVYGYRPDGSAINATQNLAGCTIMPYQDFAVTAVCPEIGANYRVGDPFAVDVSVENVGDTRLLSPTESWNRTEAPGNFLTIGYERTVTRVFTTALTAEDIAAGSVPLNISITAQDRAPGPLTRTLEITCSLPAQLLNGTVTVVDADGVTPVAGATVTLSNDRSMVTGADGVATFPDLLSGEYAVSVTAPDGRTATGTLSIATSDGAVTVQLDQVFTQLTVGFDCPAFDEPVNRGDVVTFTLTLTNNSNVTITGTRSSIYQNSSRTNFYASPAIPTSLAPGQTVTATITYPISDQEVSQGWLYGTAQVNGYRPNGTAITGRQSLRSCTFVPNITFDVSAVCPQIPQDAAVGDSFTIPVTILNTGDANLVSPTVTSTRAEAGPRLLTIGPGGTRTFNYVTALTQADLDAGMLVGDVSVTVNHTYAGRITETATLNCVIDPKTYSGTVTVVDADGTTPVSGATVELATGQSATTGADGTASFTDLVNGRYAVTVTAADGRTASGTLVIADAQGAVTIQLPEHVYSGVVTVVDADGTTPVEGATVTLGDDDDDDSDNLTGVTNVDGSVTFNDLVNGEYAVTVTAADGRTAIGTLVVNDADGSARIQLPAATYTGTVKVVDSDEITPIVGATVSFNPTGVTGEDGTVSFSGLASGTYQVTATAPDGRTATATMTISNSDGGVTIVMPAVIQTPTPGETPTPGVTPTPGETPAPGQTPAPGETPAPSATKTSASPVTSLPSTGAGERGLSPMLILGVSLSVLIGGCALVLDARRRNTGI